MCHLPERSPESLYPILPDRAVTPEVTFEESVPERLRGLFVAELRLHLSNSPLAVVPRGARDSLVVSIRVSLVRETGRTDAGALFHAARARAVVVLHRSRIEVDGGHAAARTAPEAAERALARLREKVALALTW